MTLKTLPWDSAAHLRTEKERAAYLAACMAEAGDDPGFIAHALGIVARSRGMSELARESGLTREGLYKALSRSANPSFGTVLKVLDALGYRLSVVVKPKRRAVAKRAPAVRASRRATANEAAPKSKPRARRSAQAGLKR